MICRFPILILAVAALACGGNTPPSKLGPAAELQQPVRPFPAEAFAGQSIAVTPLTMLISDQPGPAQPPLADRIAGLAWADSLVGATLQARGTEVKWVLPPELRKIARRAPTVAPDPDRMGQSLLRAEGIKTVPDPLRGQLRALTALVGGRFVLVPAALLFHQEPAGTVVAELSLVLADTRNGDIVWRTVARASGAAPEKALTDALATVFPVALGLR